MFGLGNSWFRKEKPVFTGYRMGFGVHITPPRGVGFTIGTQDVRVVENFEQEFSWQDGDAITADKSGYYTFRIKGAKGGGSGGSGGTTLAEVYMAAGTPLYVKSIYADNSYNTPPKSGGEGIAITTTNELRPSSNRPATTVIVAGGGGGRSSNYGGSGGGWEGGQGRGEGGPNPYFVGGGTQTGGGGGSNGGGSGGTWYGGQGSSGGQGWGPGGGGGHGWYGGGGAGGDNGNNHGGGGGASGYISNTLRTPDTHGNIKVGTATTTTNGGGNTVGPTTPQGGATLEIRSTAI